MKFFVPTNSVTDGTTLIPLLDENKQEVGISVKITGQGSSGPANDEDGD